MRQILWLFVFTFLLPSPLLGQQRFDAAALLKHVEVLAADSLEGRRTGSEGSRKAQAYIQEAFTALGLQPFGRTYARPFSFGRAGDGAPASGVNLVGYIQGTVHPDAFIVLSAHYDHVGVKQGEIYNGADDNASGVAGLLAAADYFSRHAPAHSIIFVAFDAEEIGLNGAYAFLEEPPVDRDRLVLNVNLDMISRSDEEVLYAAGTYHYPFLKPLLERVAARSKVHLRFGHDRPELGPHDWTLASDHGPFHRAGIPFIYFGVEDHADYHRPSDVYERIHPDFFIRAVDTIIEAVAELDAHGSEIRMGAAY